MRPAFLPFLAPLLFTPLPSPAQRLPPLVAGVAERVPGSRPAPPGTPFGHPDDHRTEGLVAGAILIGLPVSVIAFGLCGDTDTGGGGGCFAGGLGVGVVGFLVGGLTGALIREAIPKARSPTAAPPTGVVRGPGGRRP